MAMEDFIRNMPKADLQVRLEGGYRKETFAIIADQNDIAATTKNYTQWLNQLDNPDYSRLDEIILTLTQWLRHPDDLTRIVYDLGLSLAKQNVKYAEVSVNPALHMLPGMSFDEFLTAINDGRDRVQRGWGIRLNWILVLPREEPRRADEIVRWAMSVTGKKGGVVAMGLAGREDAQPVGQFERAFINAQKKDLPTVAQAGDIQGAEIILEVLTQLKPSRLIDAWGAADAPDILRLLSETGTPLSVSLARTLCLGQAKSYADYPLRHLYDENVNVMLGSDMPGFFKSSLSDEYLAAVEHCGLSLDELEEIALHAVEFSFLSPEEKATMLSEFKQEYSRLRTEHIVQQTT